MVAGVSENLLPQAIQASGTLPAGNRRATRSGPAILFLDHLAARGSAKILRVSSLFERLLQTLSPAN